MLKMLFLVFTVFLLANYRLAISKPILLMSL